MVVTLLVVIGVVVAWITGNIWIAILAIGGGLALLEMFLNWLRHLVHQVEHEIEEEEIDA